MYNQYNEIQIPRKEILIILIMLDLEKESDREYLRELQSLEDDIYKDTDSIVRHSEGVRQTRTPRLIETVVNKVFNGAKDRTRAFMDLILARERNKTLESNSQINYNRGVVFSDVHAQTRRATL